MMKKIKPAIFIGVFIMLLVVFTPSVNAYAECPCIYVGVDKKWEHWGYRQMTDWTYWGFDNDLLCNRWDAEFRMVDRSAWAAKKMGVVSPDIISILIEIFTAHDPFIEWVAPEEYRYPWWTAHPRYVCSPESQKPGGSPGKMTSDHNRGEKESAVKPPLPSWAVPALPGQCCSQDDGWYCDEASDITQHRECDGQCGYTVTDTKNCNDLYDGWHCVGENKRQKWDGYCEQGSLLVCDYDVLVEEDCDDYDSPCCLGNSVASCDYSCVGGSCFLSGILCSEDEECVDGECQEVTPEFPAGVTAVFGATFFIFLIMRRKYVRK